MNLILQNRTFKGIALAMVSTVTWASLCVIGRYLFGSESESCNALVMSTFRNLIGAVMMVAFVFFCREQHKIATALRRDGAMLFALALVGAVLEGTLQIWSLKYTTAARCSLFANTAPIYTLLIAHFALKEPFTRRNVTGMSIGLAGVVIVAISEGADVFASGRMLLGDLIALLSGVCWAAFTVYGVGVTKRNGALVSATLVMCFAAVMMLPFGLYHLRGAPTMSWNLLLGIVYMGVFTAGVANVCWFSALKYLSAGATGAFGYISFGLAVLFSVLFLDEKLTVPTLLAFALVLGGVALMISGSRR